MSTDPQTLAAYNRAPQTYADDWASQPPPSDLHACVRRFFSPGRTADIGCGSGRDTAFRAAEGFDAEGFDVSEGLLTEARRRYPHLSFTQATLPELAGLPPGAYANILCETVIMHLPHAAIAPAVRRMVDLLAPAGTLYLSWRVTEGEDRRDEAGRLYAAFPPALVHDALTGTAILHDEEVGSLSSGKLIRRLIARKEAP